MQGLHRALFAIVGVFLIALGLFALIVPNAYLALYVDFASVSPSDHTGFGTRRFAPVIIALGILLWLARKLDEGPIPATLCLVSAAGFAGVAATGVMSYTAGVAGPAVLFAALSEVIAALLFVLAAPRWRKAKNLSE